MQSDTLIIGGGLSGLSAAIELDQANREFELVEAADRPGGRVRTDRVDGFALDRGFQVLLTAYPDAQRLFDYDRLDLGEFYAGALVIDQEGHHRIGDPFRHPVDGFKTIWSPVGTLADKLRVARLRNELSGNTSLTERPNISTLKALEDEYGFSPGFIDAFFRPFFGGITLDSSLSTSRRFFDFVFDMFARGTAALPSGGMERLTDQLVEQLPEERINTGHRVVDLSTDTDGARITFESGRQRGYDSVVAAVPPWHLRTITDDLEPTVTERPADGVTCSYFRAPASPLDDPILALNGTSTGPINNLVVPSDIADGYAPPNESLISVSVLEKDAREEASVESRILQQAREWFGDQVEQWDHLRTYRIRRALPAQSPEYMQDVRKPTRANDHLILAGDHRDTSSIQGALSAGRRAAENLIHDVNLPDMSSIRQA